MAGGTASGEVILDAVVDAVETSVHPMHMAWLLRGSPHKLLNVFCRGIDALRVLEMADFRSDGWCGV
jgi:hypothetical protein